MGPWELISRFKYKHRLKEMTSRHKIFIATTQNNAKLGIRVVPHNESPSAERAFESKESCARLAMTPGVWSDSLGFLGYVLVLGDCPGQFYWIPWQVEKKKEKRCRCGLSPRE